MESVTTPTGRAQLDAIVQFCAEVDRMAGERMLRPGNRLEGQHYAAMSELLAVLLRLPTAPVAALVESHLVRTATP